MGQRPLHECNKIGCTNLTRETYCKEHMYIKEERHNIYRRERNDQKEQEFYISKEYKIARTRVLKRDRYLCVRCLKQFKKITPAQTVHHIKDIKKHWSLRLYIPNMISVCESCHQTVHCNTNENDMLSKYI